MIDGMSREEIKAMEKYDFDALINRITEEQQKVIEEILKEYNQGE
jgi:hypothetical protein